MYLHRVSFNQWANGEYVGYCVIVSVQYTKGDNRRLYSAAASGVRCAACVTCYTLF